MDLFGDAPVSLEPLDGGWSGETFLAQAAGQRSVVRIFADPRHAADAAAIQASLLRLVRGLVPVPQVLESRRPAPEAGLPGLLVTEQVAGERGDLVLARLVERRDADGLAQLGEALGRVAGSLSRMPMLTSGTFADAELRLTPYDLWLPTWVEDHADRLGWAGPDLAGLREVAGEAADRLASWPRCCLVHSDLNPKNVLVDPETLTLTAVLDWEFAHAGHPATDLGNLVRFDRDPGYLAGVLAGWRAEQPGPSLRFGADPGPDDEALLTLARCADLAALVELAARREANPVAARAHDHLLAIARSGDVHALP